MSQISLDRQAAAPAHAPFFHEPEAPPRAPQPARPAAHARRALPSRRFAGTGHAPATFGELIQGREPHTGHDFLVTLPITIGSKAQFCGFEDSSALYVFPRHKSKSLQAAKLFLEAFDIRSGGILQIRSPMAEGKGLASSSADIVATLRALADYFSVDLDTDLMCAIVRRIEPTDGVMFDGSVAFRHRRVELHRRIGPLPRMCVLAVDEGGVVDTVTYNRNTFDFPPDEQARYGELLAEVEGAIGTGDVRRLGRAATVSARLHQKRNPKRWLDDLEALMPATGADGIVNCHSGTFLGLCFAASEPESLDRIARAESLMSEALQQRVHRFFSK